MGRTHDGSTQNPAEQLCWEVSWRDGCRLARRLYRKQLIKGGYRLDEGAAVLDDCFHFLQARGVTALPEQMHGAAIQRQMGLFMRWPDQIGCAGWEALIINETSS
jgi:hypothetical protein